MKRSRIALIAVALLLLAGLATTTGCRRVRLDDGSAGTAGTVNQTETVPMGAATSLKTTVRMAVGSLQLRAGEPSSTLALDGTFSSPVASWKPEVKYAVEATRGTLSVVQPEVKELPGLSIGRSDSSWRLALAPGVPTDLALEMGAGESKVNLRGIDVTSLDVISAVGEMTLDLSGARPHDITGRIESGVGQMNIVVPRDVGVRLVGGEEGLGELRASGFSKSDGGLVNPAWSKPGPKIDLRLVRGIGEIRVTSAE